jgi:hypothetical protein
MSYKSQMFPSSSTCETPWRRMIGQSWGASPAESQDMTFLRSWLVYDSEIQVNPAPSRTTWNVVLGLGVAIAASACFWVGVGLMIARIWK